MSKILLIEGNGPEAAQLSAQLRQEGCEVRTSDDAAQALKQARSERPDLIVLAAELPEGSGYSVCNTIRKDDSLKSVPLIIVASGHDTDALTLHRKLKTRADEYVDRSGAFDEIVKRMRQEIVVTIGPEEAPSSRAKNSKARAVPKRVTSPRASSSDALPEEPPANAKMLEPRRVPTLPLPNPTLQATPEEDVPVASAPAAASEGLRARSTVPPDSGDMSNSARDRQDTSHRRIVELCEALHQRDAELLAVRAEVGRREHEALDLKSQLLGFERLRAELTDRIQDLETEIEQAAEAAVAQVGTHAEAIAKAQESFEQRLEGELRIRQELENAIQLADAERASAIRARDEEHASELATVRKRHDEMLAAANADRERTRLALETELERCRSELVELRDLHARDALSTDEQRAYVVQELEAARELVRETRRQADETLRELEREAAENLEAAEARYFEELRLVREEADRFALEMRNEKNHKLQEIRELHARMLADERLAHAEAIGAIQLENEAKREAERAEHERARTTLEITMSESMNRVRAAQESARVEWECRITDLQQELERRREEIAQISQDHAEQKANWQRQTAQREQESERQHQMALQATIDEGVTQLASIRAEHETTLALLAEGARNARSELEKQILDLSQQVTQAQSQLESERAMRGEAERESKRIGEIHASDLVLMADLRRLVQSTDDKCRREIAELKVKHHAAILALNEEHDRTIENMEREREASIGMAREEYEQRVQAHASAEQSIRSALQADHARIQESAREEIARLRELIERNQKQHDQELREHISARIEIERSHADALQASEASSREMLHAQQVEHARALGSARTAYEQSMASTSDSWQTLKLELEGQIESLMRDLSESAALVDRERLGREQAEALRRTEIDALTAEQARRVGVWEAERSRLQATISEQEGRISSDSLEINRLRLEVHEMGEQHARALEEERVAGRSEIAAITEHHTQTLELARAEYAKALSLAETNWSNIETELRGQVSLLNERLEQSCEELQRALSEHAEIERRLSEEAEKRRNAFRNSEAAWHEQRRELEVRVEDLRLQVEKHDEIREEALRKQSEALEAQINQLGLIHAEALRSSSQRHEREIIQLETTFAQRIAAMETQFTEDVMGVRVSYGQAMEEAEAAWASQKAELSAQLDAVQLTQGKAILALEEEVRAMQVERDSLRANTSKLETRAHEARMDLETVRAERERDLRAAVERALEQQKAEMDQTKDLELASAIDVLAIAHRKELAEMRQSIREEARRESAERQRELEALHGQALRAAETWSAKRIEQLSGEHEVELSEARAAYANALLTAETAWTATRNALHAEIGTLREEIRKTTVQTALESEALTQMLEETRKERDAIRQALGAAAATSKEAEMAFEKRRAEMLQEHHTMLETAVQTEAARLREEHQRALAQLEATITDQAFEAQANLENALQRAEELHVALRKQLRSELEAQHQDKLLKATIGFEERLGSMAAEHASAMEVARGSYERSLNQLDGSFASARRQLEAQFEELAQDQKRRIERTEAEMTILRDQNASLERELAEKRRGLEKSSERLTELEQAAQEHRAQVLRIEGDLLILKSEKEEMALERSELQAALEAARIDGRDLEHRLKLQEELAETRTRERDVARDVLAHKEREMLQIQEREDKLKTKLVAERRALEKARKAFAMLPVGGEENAAE